MDQQEFEATAVGVATAQFNARLEAVAAGQEAPRLTTDEGEAVLLSDARPFLLSGLDIDADALDGLANGAVANLTEDIGRAGGYLNMATLDTALVAMFVTGVLHERERARREAASREEAGDAA